MIDCLIRVNEQSGKQMDQYLQSRLRQMQENLTGEFNMVCNHHRDLQLLQVRIAKFCGFLIAFGFL